MNMIKNIILLAVSATILLFSSCSNNVEEIWVNGDGTGKYEMTQDLSQLLPFVQMAMMAGEGDEDTPESEKSAKDQGMSKIKEIFARGVVDTSFVIEDIAKEMAAKKGETFSLEDMKQKMYNDAGKEGVELSAKEKETLGGFMESLVKSTLRIKMDSDKNMLKLTTSQRFNGLDKMLFSSLTDLFDIVAQKDMSASSGDLEKLQQAKNMMGSIPKYEVKNNTLYITRDAIDMESMDPEAKQNFNMMKGMMGQSNYKTIIHVPGKVKGVSQNAATYKGSTVTWEIPYNDLYDTSKDLDIRIKFKPKKKIKY